MFNLLFAIGVVGAIASILPIVLALIDPAAGYTLLIGAGLTGLTSSFLFMGLGKLGQVASDIRARLPKAETSQANDAPGIGVGSALVVVALVAAVSSALFGFRYAQHQKAVAEAYDAAQLERSMAEIDRFLESRGLR